MVSKTVVFRLISGKPVIRPSERRPSMGTIMARGWPSFLARNSGRTKSSRHWAQEAWGKFTAPVTRGWSAPSPSKCCLRASPTARSCANAWNARLERVDSCTDSSIRVGRRSHTGNQLSGPDRLQSSLAAVPTGWRPFSLSRLQHRAEPGTRLSHLLGILALA